MTALYDTIGLNYAQLRRPDIRIANQIDRALGNARSVLNVGAGAGSYEPVARVVTAVEPSAKMMAQRIAPAAAVVQAFAEELPFEDDTFDASMAVLTIHHWQDKEMGVREMRRVTRGPMVFLTHDPAFRGFWLTEYLPQLIAIDDGKMPPLADFGEWLGDVVIEPVPVPHDCTDGFLAAYWRRPSAYLDDRVRAAISSFWALGDIREILAQLKADLDDGSWALRHADLLERESLDCGYRLVIAR
ncbi:MAG: class I SAM-dependent methyltransferase [Nitratireductor sp.]